MGIRQSGFGKQSSSEMIRFVPLEDQQSWVTKNHAQLLLCTQGRLRLEGQHGYWSLSEGHMVFIPSQRPYRLTGIVESQTLLVRFRHNEVSWLHDGCWVAVCDAFAQQFLYHGLKWSSHLGQPSDQSCAYFVTLGDMIPDWFRNARINWSAEPENQLMDRLLSFVTKNISAATLPDAARHIGMSERTLRRRIGEDLGQNWRSLLRETRMKVAMESLRETNAPITSIALEIGFASSAAFSHAFTQHLGLTPRDYAKRHRSR
jgi:AraC-like DNA-binding protein